VSEREEQSAREGRLPSAISLRLALSIAAMWSEAIKSRDRWYTTYCEEKVKADELQKDRSASNA
jgi:hypothetical protein